MMEGENWIGSAVADWPNALNYRRLACQIADGGYNKGDELEGNCRLTGCYKE
jgi:hypothetical protein